MVLYRRNFVSGGQYFFTVNAKHRKKDTFVKYHNELRTAFRESMSKSPFHIDAIVILPDHLHAILTLPPGDSDYPTRWRNIKRSFTFHLIKKGLHQKGATSLWQDRYWEHTIRNERDLENHINYIHYNPVKHAYVYAVDQWQYSSIHTYMKKGISFPNWKNFIPPTTVGEK